MKISDLRMLLDSMETRHGDIEINQLQGIYSITKEGNLQYVAEQIVPIKKVKYNKKRNICLIDFV